MIRFLRVHETALPRGQDTMRFVNHVCRRCSRRMQQVANIDANGSTPGLWRLCVLGADQRTVFWFTR
jgi:hypothetical protein